MFQLFHDAGPYHIEIGPLICRTNRWAGFYMIGTSVMNELRTALDGYFYKGLYLTRHKHVHAHLTSNTARKNILSLSSLRFETIFKCNCSGVCMSLSTNFLSAYWKSPTKTLEQCPSLLLTSHIVMSIKLTLSRYSYKGCVNINEWWYQTANIQ